MKRLCFLTAALGSLVCVSQASAVTITLTQGPADPLYFASLPDGDNNFTLDGITWTGVSGVVATRKGTNPYNWAAPLGMGVSPTSGTTYFAVGYGVEKATWATPQTGLDIYWGSIDGDVCGAGSQSCGNLNAVTIASDGFTLTGKDLIAYGALGEGSQTNPLDNQWVSITGLAPFTTAEFSSPSAAFEFSLALAPPTPFTATIPEPSTWAMMLIGFSGLGYAAFRRSAQERLATDAI